MLVTTLWQQLSPGTAAWGLHDCVEKNYEMLAMTTSEASSVNARQCGILHFLTDMHLQSLYSLAKEATEQAPVRIAVWNIRVCSYKHLPGH